MCNHILRVGPMRSHAIILLTGIGYMPPFLQWIVFPLHVFSRTFVLFTAVEARLKLYSFIYLYHDIGGSDVLSSADPLLDFNWWVSKARTNYISVQMFFDLDEKEKPAQEKNTVANIDIDFDWLQWCWVWRLSRLWRKWNLPPSFYKLQYIYIEWYECTQIALLADNDEVKWLMGGKVMSYQTVAR